MIVLELDTKFMWITGENDEEPWPSVVNHIPMSYSQVHWRWPVLIRLQPCSNDICDETWVLLICVIFEQVNANACWLNSIHQIILHWLWMLVILEFIITHKAIHIPWHINLTLHSWSYLHVKDGNGSWQMMEMWDVFKNKLVFSYHRLLEMVQTW